DDSGLVVRRRAEIDPLGGALEERVEIDGAEMRVLRRIADDEDIPQERVGELALRLLEDRHEVAVDRDADRSRVLREIRELLRRRTPADRHARRSRARRGRPDLDELLAVLHHDDDALLASDAAAREPAREPIDAFVELPPARRASMPDHRRLARRVL